MSANGKTPRGQDISIVKLVPRNERKVPKKYRQRIEASIRAVGLIDPLVVFPLDDSYEILDGALRYRILLDLGVESVPCLIHSDRDGFTGNRMVNQLSASQEMRMLRKSLEELDEKTPWTQADEKKSQLLKKLQEAEQQQNFYSGLYRQYTTNLLKLVIYVRTLLGNPEVKAYMQSNHAELTRVFEDILENTEG
ncbi:ParB/RepB/Spo0J family partition protein [Planctomycetaceae bacterium SH139]